MSRLSLSHHTHDNNRRYWALPLLLCLVIALLLIIPAHLNAWETSNVTSPSEALASPGPALQVNAGAGQHPISPYIYGMNFADEDLAQDLQLPVRRWGGNATTRYNWQNDISNHASDWYFENIKESDASALPGDSAVIRFIEQDRRTNTASLLTLPTIGYVSNNNTTACGFSQIKYGTQTGNDW